MASRLMDLLGQLDSLTVSIREEAEKLTNLESNLAALFAPKGLAAPTPAGKLPVLKAPSVKAPVPVDENGNPIKRPRGRPRKNPVA